jgi:hypothetical protein
MIINVFIIGLVMLLSIENATAQSPPDQPAGDLRLGDKVQILQIVPPVEGEFRATLLGEIRTIGCTAPGGTYLACLNFRALAIGDDVSKLRESHKEVREHSRTGNSAALLVPLEWAEQQDGRRTATSYLVVTTEGTKIVALQLTGKSGGDPYMFSSVRLGAPRQQLVNTLGLPSAVRDAPEIKGKTWDYHPFPFSIQLVNQSVYSIRIHMPRPEDGKFVFRPLESVQD